MTDQGMPDRPQIAESVLDLIGDTPLVRLGKIGRDLPCPLVAKLETTNPGGSAKDRPALEMVLAAERDGLLPPGGTIVEPTSGNTGVGLAIVAAQRGYHCHFVTTDKVAPEKIDFLRAYGAEVTVCPVAVPPEDPTSYYSTAERLVREIPGAYRPNQYANPANPLAHEKTTGPEIWRQTAGRVTHFVAGAGTCGTVTGVGRYLKRVNPDVQIVAADPEGSVFSGGSGRPYLTEGVGEDFFPDAWDPTVIDRVVACSDEESYLMARRVAREEGLLLGSSGGLAVAAAIKVARDATADDLVVLLIPDSGRGYLSRVYNDEWMATFGFVQECELCVGVVLEARSEDLPPLLYVNPGQTARQAVRVDAGQRRVAAAGVQEPASVRGGRGVGRGRRAPAHGRRIPRSVRLGHPGREGDGTEAADRRHRPAAVRAVELLDHAPALLVLSGGRPLAVLTRTDVLTFLSPGGS